METFTEDQWIVHIPTGNMYRFNRKIKSDQVGVYDPQKTEFYEHVFRMVNIRSASNAELHNYGNDNERTGGLFGRVKAR